MNDGQRPPHLAIVATPPRDRSAAEVETLRRELAEAIRLMPTDTTERQQWTVRAFTAVNGRLQ